MSVQRSPARTGPRCSKASRASAWYKYCHVGSSTPTMSDCSWIGWFQHFVATTMLQCSLRVLWSGNAPETLG